MKTGLYGVYRINQKMSHRLYKQGGKIAKIQLDKTEVPQIPNIAEKKGSLFQMAN